MFGNKNKGRDQTPNSKNDLQPTKSVLADRPTPTLSWRRIVSMTSNVQHSQDVEPGQLAFPPLKCRPADTPNLQLTERLLAAYYAAMQQGGSSGDGLWEVMRTMFHEPFIEALEKQDVAAVAAELAVFFGSPISAGICHRPASADELENDSGLQLLTADVIASFSAALGLSPVSNPAAPVPRNALDFDVTATLQSIREKLGWDICPPQVAGIFGFELEGKLIPLKHLYQVYVAHRMKQMVGYPIGSCLEIGGGVGFLAYACLSAGTVRDFCIIDLPLVNMLQGYLLLSSDFAECVQLFGEPDLEISENGRRIRVFPDHSISTLPDKSFDWAVNQDSLPEMAHGTMTNYIDEISRLVDGKFYSINHESQQVVQSGFQHGLVAHEVEHRPDFRQVFRHPYWLRRGYVEECFEVRSPKD